MPRKPNTQGNGSTQRQARFESDHVEARHIDVWMPPAGTPVVAEAYPSLWRGRYSVEDRAPDQHDAYTACRWLQEADASDKLARCFAPALTDRERAVAASSVFMRD